MLEPILHQPVLLGDAAEPPPEQFDLQNCKPHHSVRDLDDQQLLELVYCPFPDRI